ncbi:transposase [Frankia sp. CiP3]|uniref:transposase n=1 Tax=Frankia sp. CiP3 TaxID=2880971 RepID=UPI001EF5A3EA|nr:transposase [Frankia sp. CiP3]
MFEGTAVGVAALLGLAGCVVDTLEWEADGSPTLHVLAAPGTVTCCPGCGTASVRVRERAAHTAAHLALVPLRVTLHKRVLACENTACSRTRFVEDPAFAAPGGRVTLAALDLVAHLVGDGMFPVSTVARWAGIAWHTVHDAFVALAQKEGIHTGDPAEVGEALAAVLADATATDPGLTDDPDDPDDGDDPDGEPTDDLLANRRAAGWDADATDASTLLSGPPVAESDPTVKQPDAAPAQVAAPRRFQAVFGILPDIRVLGIDDHCRGRPRWHRDPVTGTSVQDADRWTTSFYDSTGGNGLLGAVETRKKAPAVAWILAQPAEWRARIQCVTTDLSNTYRAVARAALPDAIVIADLFHVAQLIVKMVADVRRRVSRQVRRRRGRATDPEYRYKNLFGYGPLRLSERGLKKIHEVLALLAEHDPDAAHDLRVTWTAAQHLLRLLALAPSRTGRATTRTDISRGLYRFFDHVATFGRDVPELVTAAETIDQWRDEITAGVLTGITNAAAEGINRLTKLIYRVGFGMTNVADQQRRARYTASRAARAPWRPTVTAPTITA